MVPQRAVFHCFPWLVFIVYMDHFFFIHLSVDGHLGCFHVLAIVNSAAMNIGVHVTFVFVFNVTFFFNLFYFFGSVGSLLLHAGFFSSCGEWWLLFIAVHGLLFVVASHCGARALGVWASVFVAYGLSSCGSQALELRLSNCGARA